MNGSLRTGLSNHERTCDTGAYLPASGVTDNLGFAELEGRRPRRQTWQAGRLPYEIKNRRPQHRQFFVDMEALRA